MTFLKALERILRSSAVASTGSDDLALVRACAYASTVTCVRGRAALRLALVILEHEEGVRAGLERRAIQGLVGSITLPLAYAIRAC